MATLSVIAQPHHVLNHFTQGSCRRHSWHAFEEGLIQPALTRHCSQVEISLQTSQTDEDSDLDWPRPSTSFEQGKHILESLDFNTLQFSAEDLLLFTLEIFNKIGVTQALPISQRKLKKFILSIRHCMYDNHYHNWAHAFDVVQASYSFALCSGVWEELSVLQKFALIAAALCHDLEHPGVSNQFLVNSRAELAIIYSDRSVLENHHSFRAFQLMNSEAIDLLSELSKEAYLEFRKIMIGCILATDMARHGEFVATLKERVQQPDADDDLLLTLKLLVKCADISNVTRPFPVAKEWARRITLELFLQGDKERALGLPLTPTCDREAQDPAALQRGFATFVALPYLELLARFLPGLRVLPDRVRSNGQHLDHSQPT